jgi:chorismate mutase/prephenate dehydrogenase
MSERCGDPLDPLGPLRDSIRELDRELVRLAAERVRIAREIGGHKRASGLPTVDYSQERRVLERAREGAADAGLDGEVGEELVARLIRAAVTAQEEDSLRHFAHGRERSAVIYGGAGRMGRWMDRFLSSQGWEVAVLDPRLSEEENRAARERLADARAGDLVVMATPPGRTAAIYREWLGSDPGSDPEGGPPDAVLVDLASIKTPLVEPIAALRAAGARVASIHPMFGPSTVLLRDAEVVVCSVGDEPRDREAAELAETLFAATTARLVRLPLEEHDRVMADLLSLAHAAAIAFALALPEAEHAVRSTTFRALEELSAAVVRESPDVYYEIQAENPHSAAALARLHDALDRVRAAVASRSPEAFAELLGEGRRRTSGT